MSWDQLILLFDVDRNEDGSAKIVPADDRIPLTQEQIFRRSYYLLGITDQDVVDREWAKEKAKREAKKLEELSQDPRWARRQQMLNRATHG